MEEDDVIAQKLIITTHINLMIDRRHKRHAIDTESVWKSRPKGDPKNQIWEPEELRSDRFLTEKQFVGL
jgi:hypothetical protein